MNQLKFVYAILFIINGFNKASALSLDFSFVDTLFTVSHIEGQITNQTQGQDLAFYDRFSSSNELTFRSSKDYVIVVDERTFETFKLVPKDSNLKGHQTLVSDMRPNIRPGNILTYIALTRFLQDRRYVILDGQTKIQVGKQEFPMDDSHFFFIQYKWAGDKEPVNKKLPFQKDTLMIIQEELFKIDGNPIKKEDASDFKLYYYDLEKTESLFINHVILVFPDEEKLKKEVQLLIDLIGTDDRDLLFQKIDSHIYTIYGEPNIAELRAWLWKYFRIGFD